MMISKPGNLLRMLVNCFRRKRVHVSEEVMRIHSFFLDVCFQFESGLFLFYVEMYLQYQRKATSQKANYKKHIVKM